MPRLLRRRHPLPWRCEAELEHGGESAAMEAAGARRSPGVAHRADRHLGLGTAEAGRQGLALRPARSTAPTGREPRPAGTWRNPLEQPGRCRPNAYYGGLQAENEGDGNEGLEVGTLAVTFPPDHAPGKIERPLKVFSFSLRDEDPDRDVVISELRSFGDGHAAWAVELRATGRDQAFIYVHGFQTSFEQAASARRSARLRPRLRPRGRLPRRAHALQLAVARRGRRLHLDYDTSFESIEAFNLFLDMVKEQAGIRRVHVIAHSMGNRVVAEALYVRACGPSRSSTNSCWRRPTSGRAVSRTGSCASCRAWRRGSRSTSRTTTGRWSCRAGSAWTSPGRPGRRRAARGEPRRRPLRRGQRLDPRHRLPRPRLLRESRLDAGRHLLPAQGHARARPAAPCPRRLRRQFRPPLEPPTIARPSMSCTSPRKPAGTRSRKPFLTEMMYRLIPRTVTHLGYTEFKARRLTGDGLIPKPLGARLPCLSKHKESERPSRSSIRM